MKITKKLVVLLSLISSAIFAADKEDNRSPIGCQDAGYQFDLKTLQLLPTNSGSGESLYFIYNISNRPVTLFQMRDEDSSRSMYFNHQIPGAYWSVLATCEKKMKYLCAVGDDKTPFGEILDCQDVLKVCQYTNVKFGLNNRGNYWLVSTSNKNDAIREVVRYGIIPAI